MKQFTFDLQRFAEGDEGYTIDQALEVLNGNAQPAQQPETAPAEQEVVTEEVQTEQEPEEVEHQPEEQQQEAPAIDYNLKVKFKANGQDKVVTIAQLIEMAQKGSNYEKRMEEIAQKEKAFQAAAPQIQNDPVKQLEEFQNKVMARAMQKLNITNPEEFQPDSSGILGNKLHYIAEQQAILEVQQEMHNEEMQQREVMQVENTYYETVTQFEADPQFETIKDYAVNAMFALPQKGKEGVKEFNEMYGIYQKVQQREQYWADMQRFGQSTQRVQPFTRAEVEKLTKFYNDCKAEYGAKQQKEQVKQQVPKNIPIKPTVKVEAPGDNGPAPAKKVDFKKFQSMDLDEIAKLL
jgi:hypothetical protein